LHLSLQTCAQDISHFLAGQALAFQQRFGHVFDHAPVIVYKISRSRLQVFECAVAFPSFPMQAKQQFYRNGLITIGIAASDALGGNMPLCLKPGERTNNSAMVAQNAPS
jgi:hypothetical protein